MTSIDEVSSWQIQPVLDRLTPIERKLVEFSSLKTGWSVMGEGEPILEPICDRARELFYLFRNMGFTFFELQPGLAGEILVSTGKDGYTVEVVVVTENSFELYIEQDGTDIFQETEVNWTQLMTRLRGMQDQWDTLECLIQNIISQKIKDSPGWPLGPHQMAASLYSKSNVRMDEAAQSVPIYRNIMAA